MHPDILRRAPMRFAHVALPVPVNKLFTYEIPDDIAGSVYVGCRVDVPFGRRMLSGVVSDLADRADVPGVRPIKRLRETYLPAPLFRLARWIAAYYGCTVGEAVQSVLPPALRRAKVRRRAEGVLAVADRALRAGGETSPEMNAVRADLSRARKQLALIVELLRAGGEAPLRVVLDEWGYRRPVADTLVKRGTLVLRAAPAPGSGLDAMDGNVERLTRAQEDALQRLDAALVSKKFAPVLLYGVTGSGKTEVYLRTARHVLAQGGGCIVLVPEIGLLPQATARYRRMFGDDVAIIHSRLSGPERFAIWESLVHGRRRIVVGPRSAVFMPVQDLRLIVVDEEQDDSYKQDDKPRYHARSVALMRGKYEELTVVLGSATPSAESLHRAMDSRYQWMTLRERAGGSPLPRIRIVDMRSGEDGNPPTGVFSGELVGRIDRNIKAGFQTIIFLNKRGHARFVQCNACGWVATCRNCDISLTYHRVDRTMRCHFCGYTRRVVDRCEGCGGVRLFYSGVGTQRVELELQSLFPGVGVLRMDADTTSGKEGHRRILEEFCTGEYPILLGTQMVSKGHHFPGVSLVGVICAEEGLNFPDFRSAERTFQMLTQVSGRAGRGEQPGEVIIQTYMPDHYVFRYLQDHDYDGFMREELELRRSLGYPPYSRVILASCSARDEHVLHAVTGEWAELLRSVLHGALADGRVKILGPTEPLVARIRGRFRDQILIKGTLSQTEKDAALDAYTKVSSNRPGGRTVDLRWDVDPESFL